MDQVDLTVPSLVVAINCFSTDENQWIKSIWPVPVGGAIKCFSTRWKSMDPSWSDQFPSLVVLWRVLSSRSKSMYEVDLTSAKFGGAIKCFTPWKSMDQAIWSWAKFGGPIKCFITRWKSMDQADLTSLVVLWRVRVLVQSSVWSWSDQIPIWWCYEGSIICWKSMDQVDLSRSLFGGATKGPIICWKSMEKVHLPSAQFRGAVSCSKINNRQLLLF